MSVTEALSLGAFELRRVYNRNLGIAFGVAVGLHLLLVGMYMFGLNIGKAGDSTKKAPISTSVTLTNIDAPPPAEDIPPPPPPPMIPPELMSASGGGGGVAARAGAPIPVPDALITPDMQDFATTEEISVAVPEGGDGTGFGIGDGDGLGAIEIETPVQVEQKEKEPDMFEFVPVEKEPGFDLGALQRRVKYPPIARDNGIEGQVVVRVLIDKTGRPVKSAVQHSDNKLLEQAAVEAVMNTTFTPAIQNQNPVQLWISIPVTFQLN